MDDIGRLDCTFDIYKDSSAAGMLDQFGNYLSIAFYTVRRHCTVHMTFAKSRARTNIFVVGHENPGTWGTHRNDLVKDFPWAIMAAHISGVWCAGGSVMEPLHFLESAWSGPTLSIEWRGAPGTMDGDVIKEGT